MFFTHCIVCISDNSDYTKKTLELGAVSVKKIKEMFQSPQSRYGTYSMVITAVVIAIVIVINMIAGQLPDSMKSVDLSGNSLYEITKTSKKL